MPLTNFGGALGKKRAAHLLRRTTFGATKQQIDDFASLTAAQAINQLFRQTLPDPPLPLDPKTGQEWITKPTTDANSKDGELEDYFLGWFVGQMLNTSSLAYAAREKLVFFIHTHFTTIRSKVSSPKALYFQNQLFRLFTLDATADPKINFKDLTKKICVDNAMIRLLDCDQNVKGNPNENFARELLELYSIGKGLENSASLPTDLPDGDYPNYSEKDIQIAARILSGWDFDGDFSTPDLDTNLPKAKVKGSLTNASSHDNDATKPKTLSTEHFQGVTINPDPLLLNGGNATEESALDEISKLIDVIFAQHETSKNICRKVYRFFVYHEINDVIDNDIIEAMATTFENNNFKLQYVIEQLLKSTYFYEYNSGVTDDAFGGIIKSPLDLAVGSLRLFNYTLPDMTSATAEFYAETGYIVGGMSDMGMKFYEPYDVAGYDAYHQWPIYHRSWITPNYLANRYKFIESLISNVSQDNININMYDWIKANFDAFAGDADALAPELTNYLFPVPNAEGNPGLTDARFNYFRLKLIQGFDNAYWTNLWNTSGSDELRIPITALMNAMLQSPEYQLQ